MDEIEIMEMDEEVEAEAEVEEKPKKRPSKMKRFGKKILKYGGIAVGGLVALGSVFKLGEAYGRRDTLSTLDGYKMRIDTNSDDSIMETMDD